MGTSVTLGCANWAKCIISIYICIRTLWFLELPQWDNERLWWWFEDINEFVISLPENANLQALRMNLHFLIITRNRQWCGTCKQFLTGRVMTEPTHTILVQACMLIKGKFIKNHLDHCCCLPCYHPFENSKDVLIFGENNVFIRIIRDGRLIWNTIRLEPKST